MKKSILLLTKPTYVAALILLMSFLILSCDQLFEEGITADEAKALVEKDQKIWNEGNMAMADEIIATDYVQRSTASSENLVGIDAFKELIINVRTQFPDFSITVEELIVKDDKIVWRWIMTGTNTGSVSDIPPTGKKMQCEGGGILHVVDGKIVERLIFYNEADMLTQLGYTITPPTIEVVEE
jgi:steroid delta-isomerase-like uncharacterized protein